MQSTQPAGGGSGRAAGSAAPAGGSLRWAGAVTAAAVLGGGAVGAGAYAGWWWVPFAVGAVLGVAGRCRGVRRGWALLVPALAAVAGWALPLVRLAVQGAPVGATSRTVAALAGLPGSAVLPITVTLLLAAVQALTGTWLARALTPRRWCHD
jgi:hypothetical protein